MYSVGTSMSVPSESLASVGLLSFSPWHITAQLLCSSLRYYALFLAARRACLQLGNHLKRRRGLSKLNASTSRVYVYHVLALKPLNYFVIHKLWLGCFTLVVLSSCKMVHNLFHHALLIDFICEWGFWFRSTFVCASSIKWPLCNLWSVTQSHKIVVLTKAITSVISWLARFLWYSSVFTGYGSPFSDWLRLRVKFYHLVFISTLKINFG